MENVKIKSVDVKNLKAVSEFIAFFNGKCAHVTGENGIGKSTIIRTFTDRLRGLKPSIITKIGEKQGKTTLELTDGCRFEWQYNNEGQDELNYFTPNSFKPVRRDVFKHICGQYFPNQFDINKFLTATEPAKRLKMISELVQVDLSNVQDRYKNAFDIRKDAKKELSILEAQIKPKPESQSFDGLSCDAEQKIIDSLKENIESKKEAIESERNALNDTYALNKIENDRTEAEHKVAYQKKLNGWFKIEDNRAYLVGEFNEAQADKSLEYHDISDTIIKLKNYGFESNELGVFLKGFTPLEQISYDKSTKPELTTLELEDPMPSSDKLNEMKVDLDVLEVTLISANNSLEDKKAELSDLNASKQVYDLQLEQFNEFQSDIKKHAEYVRECQTNVEVILAEIKAIIKETKLPDDFSIDLENKNDILFRTSKDAEYLPITNETLASSAIFIAAFKLQANYLEAFRVAHFDVSYLDYKNREKVLKEAIAMDIQLITESPAYNKEDEELQYKLTEK